MQPHLIPFYSVLVCYSAAIVCFYANELEAMLILVVPSAMNMVRWSGMRSLSKMEQ